MMHNLVRVLMYLRYSHDGEEFTTAYDDRVIAFTVNDGLLNSSMVYACVRLIDVNDPPTVFTGANGTVDTMVMYMEGQVDPLPLAPQIQVNGKTQNNHRMMNSCQNFFIFYFHLQ